MTDSPLLRLLPSFCSVLLETSFLRADNELSNFDTFGGLTFFYIYIYVYIYFRVFRREPALMGYSLCATLPFPHFNFPALGRMKA